MVVLFNILKNISGNIKSRQTSCRKYPCLNSILYLLWQSGDVEVNPGPANSTTYRKWLYEICSIVRKAISGDSPKKIWKKQPENWPPGEPYFNPQKSPIGNKVEDFLQILIQCCGDTSKLSHEIISEIDTWNSNRSRNNDKLLHMYRTRNCLKSIEQIDRSLKVLQSHLLPDNTLSVDVKPGIHGIQISVYFPTALNQQFITHRIYRSDATRKMASDLGKILHGKDPEGKKMEQDLDTKARWVAIRL
ncbi:Hypothetical predicted protein [Mytilus galloprovincialis]|uniref:Uncharacterized protein n=1 Tax=Mytilus galloprovincialis TaxID=29158 RepID=A0A8B6BQG7_MYTGA|nr:Hypothetical predicted protein [Mytilus galloprovincialis]